MIRFFLNLGGWGVLILPERNRPQPVSHQQAQDVVNDTFPGLSSIGEQRHNLVVHRASTALVKADPLSKYHPSVDIFEETGNRRDDQTDLAQHWEWEEATVHFRVDPAILSQVAGEGCCNCVPGRID